MKKEKYTFMEEDWGFRHAPIKSDGIYRARDPFSRSACAKQVEEFEKKFIVGGIKGASTYGYLWSLPHRDFAPEGTGTGYGKTSLMQATEERINKDLGAQVLESAGVKGPKFVSAYTCLNNEDMRGLYALLVSAVERWADSQQSQGPKNQSIMAAARAEIVKRIKCSDSDEEAVRQEVIRNRRAQPGGATSSPLRPEVLDGFCSADPDRLSKILGELTTYTKSRNGLAFFEAAFACLRASGIEHVFLFMDQLEYLVTNKSVTKAKKSSEIARFRTVFTQNASLGDHCHIVFTLHDRASRELESFWEVNRLPPFNPRSRENTNLVVVMRGLDAPDKITDLVRPYFNSARDQKHPMYDSIKPLNEKMFERLWRESHARPGIVLRKLSAILDIAAEDNCLTVGEATLEKVVDTASLDGDDYGLDDASSLIG